MFMRDIHLPENKSVVDNTITSFNHQFPDFEPLDTEDFYAEDHRQYHYQAFISDNGNITLEFPVAANANPASIVVSESFELIKSNESFQQELARLSNR